MSYDRIFGTETSMRGSVFANLARVASALAPLGDPKEYLMGRIKSFNDIAPVVREMIDLLLPGRGWSFAFNSRHKTLGYCKAIRRIELSRWYAMDYLDSNKEEVVETILHELAHALDFNDNGSLNHGIGWQRYCRVLGIPGATPGRTLDASKCKRFKYKVVVKDTGEVVGGFFRKPKRDFSDSWVPGRPETRGKLVVVAVGGN